MFPVSVSLITLSCCILLAWKELTWNLRCSSLILFSCLRKIAFKTSFYYFFGSKKLCSISRIFETFLDRLAKLRFFKQTKCYFFTSGNFHVVFDFALGNFFLGLYGLCNCELSEKRQTFVGQVCELRFPKVFYFQLAFFSICSKLESDVHFFSIPAKFGAKMNSLACSACYAL